MARLLDHGLQFLAGVEGHDATRADRDLLAGLRVAPRALRLVPQLEVAEPRELYAFAALERGRSEEHTSELQSPCNLVCRLLLEKKKDQNERVRMWPVIVSGAPSSDT